MLTEVITLFGFPAGSEFIAIWISALMVCFIIINLLSIIAGILRQIGGFK